MQSFSAKRIYFSPLVFCAAVPPSKAASAPSVTPAPLLPHPGPGTEEAVAEEEEEGEEERRARLTSNEERGRRRKVEGRQAGNNREAKVPLCFYLKAFLHRFSLFLLPNSRFVRDRFAHTPINSLYCSFGALADRKIRASFCARPHCISMIVKKMFHLTRSIPVLWQLHHHLVELVQAEGGLVNGARGGQEKVLEGSKVILLILLFLENN